MKMRARFINSLGTVCDIEITKIEIEGRKEIIVVHFFSECGELAKRKSFSSLHALGRWLQNATDKVEVIDLDLL